MSEKSWSISRSIPVTTLVPIIVCICSIAVLFYRVDILEINSINNVAVYERLVSLEVEMKNMTKSLDRLLESR